MEFDMENQQIKKICNDIVKFISKKMQSDKRFLIRDANQLFTFGLYKPNQSILLYNEKKSFIALGTLHNEHEAYKLFFDKCITFHLPLTINNFNTNTFYYTSNFKISSTSITLIRPNYILKAEETYYVYQLNTQENYIINKLLELAYNSIVLKKIK